MRGMFLRHSKLSWKLAFIYASIFFIILFVLNAAVLYGVRAFLRSQVADGLNDISHNIANDIIGSPSERTPLNDPELVNVIGADEEVSVRIAGPDGIEINRSSNYHFTGAPDMTENMGKIRQLKLGGSYIMLKNSKIESNGATVAYLQVLINMNREYEFTRVLLFLMLAANITGIGFALLAGFFTSRRMLSPIDRITTTVQQIDIRELGTHVEEGKTDDELSRLARTFNGMLDRLRLSFEKQNRFVSDASHELRTPVAVIRGYADLLNRWGREDPAIYEESVHAIIHETEDMTGLIERLLLLAKSDSKALALRKADFSLPDLLEEVAVESRMLSPHHTIRYSYGEPLMICADRLMIKQALRALMENSIKFTPEGGGIELAYSVKNDIVTIMVKDTGIGIPDEEVDNIFERFYRVERSRSKATGGSGLGLSVVRIIAQSHKGTVTASSKLGEGTTVLMMLPLRQGFEA